MQSSDDELSAEEEAPAHGAGYAWRELHYGRIGWLAEHIRRSNFQIHPMVARKLLALIECSEPNLFFELKLVRRGDLLPAFKDPQLTLHRDVAMAYEVGKQSGFKRGLMKGAIYDVAERHGLEPDYVAKLIRPHKTMTLEVLAEERMAEAYQRGEVDFLGSPISPPNGFDADEEGA